MRVMESDGKALCFLRKKRQKDKKKKNQKQKTIDESETGSTGVNGLRIVIERNSYGKEYHTLAIKL